MHYDRQITKKYLIQVYKLTAFAYGKIKSFKKAI